MSFRCKRALSSTVAFGLAFGMVASPALADGDDHEEEHFDIGVWNNSGQLQTGGWDHDTESMEIDSLRVFEAHFGEDPAFPFAIDEPGIGGVAADLGLMEGSTIGLQLASGLGVWNGSGFSNASTSMFVDFGPSQVDSNSGGLLEFLVTDDYDYHPIFSIDPAAGDGAYLLEFTAAMDGYGTSDSFYIVFNLGLDDELFEESVEWVEGNLVPAPGAIAMLAIAGLAGRRRRS
ncbi:MAG: hypothetical protein GY895_04960 [Phycisphaera sp.]|nr:hypothetical protein [Phycisphaera sp.]